MLTNSTNAYALVYHINFLFFVLTLLAIYLFVMQERRYKDSPVNRPVFNMKIKALKIIDLFFNYRFYIRLQVSFYIRMC